MIPAARYGDLAGMVLHKALCPVELAINDHAPVGINGCPQTDEGVRVAEVDSEITRPFSRHIETIYDVTRTVPGIEVDRSLSSDPLSIAQSCQTYTCEAT